jgi:hypothetical protein
MESYPVSEIDDETVMIITPEQARELARALGTVIAAVGPQAGGDPVVGRDLAVVKGLRGMLTRVRVRR